MVGLQPAHGWRKSSNLSLLINGKSIAQPIFNRHPTPSKLDREGLARLEISSTFGQDENFFVEGVKTFLIARRNGNYLKLVI
jgi:hypothetical protein